jgi:phosphonate transport system substrate-binding protein
MHPINVVSLMAPSADAVHEAIVSHLSTRTGLHVRLVGEVSWPEREQLFDNGQVQIGWMCGAYYVEKRDKDGSDVTLLAAPVMAGERYAGQPVYFSDVVVNRDSRFQSFADLRGASWAYNEPRSHSGYLITQYNLLHRGELSGYFGRVIQTGAHQESLRMIQSNLVDASAIDSTVLETELARHPELNDQIRVVATFGPSPIPPAVVWGTLDPAVRQMLSDCLLTMHTDPEGVKLLTPGRISRFVTVTDRHYDLLRQMEREASTVRLQI